MITVPGLNVVDYSFVIQTKTGSVCNINPLK